MASGYTTTSAVADSLPEWIMSARTVREYDGMMPQLVDRQTLGEGLGNTWQEVSFAKLNAQAVTESTILENYQQITDANLAITPSVIGIAVLITKRVKARIVKTAMGELGGLAQAAIGRKKNDDGLTTLDGASTVLVGSGNTLASGHIAAAASRIRGNSVEPGPEPINCVLHPFQIKDLYDELVAGVGSYAIPVGPTEKVLQTGFKLPIDNTNIFPDGNTPLSGSTDAKGGVFSKMGIILVQGRAPTAYTEFHPEIGGGSDVVFHYDEYAYGERSSGNWLFEIYSDASVPSS